jgi:hypothetical protein
MVAGSPQAFEGVLMTQSGRQFALQLGKIEMPAKFFTAFGVFVLVSFFAFSGAFGQATAPKESGSKPATSSAGVSPQVSKINEEIRKGWKDAGIKPTAAASDGEWCRRVFLDVLGRIPSVQELNAFVNSKEKDKRQKLINSLLYDEKYTDDFVRNWTTIWTNILIGRSGGTGDDRLTSRAGMQKYLRDAFANNKPYDRMVVELVSAKGVSQPGEEGFNGAVNFLANKLDEGGAQATAQTSRIFLGLQVQCTQCHNHPFNDWKQQKYWEFNAFFRQARVLRRFEQGGNRPTSIELVNQDFPGEGSTPTNAEIYYEQRNGVLKSAYPVFVDNTQIKTSGYVSEVDRRAELAKLMLDSEYLPKAAVNRLWGHFLGYGFTKPIDDLGPHNQVSHPDLLNYLSDEFKKNSFDYRKLITWIVLSDPYALSSAGASKTSLASSKTPGDDPSVGDIPKFSRFYLRQMRAEELYESLIVATEAQKSRGSYEEQEAEKRDWLSQFVLAFGNDEGEEATTFNGTIPQALMLFNGDLIKKAISDEQGSFLVRLNGMPKLKPEQKIEYLFLAALARKPTKDEVAIAAQLQVLRGNPVHGMQDLWWALLNSNEFILNH